jgi:hypothetical protein
MARLTATQIANRARVAAEGMTFIVIGPYCWGRSTEAKAALANAKREYPRSMFKDSFVPTYELHEVPKDAWVADIGYIKWDGNGTAINHGAI